MVYEPYQILLAMQNHAEYSVFMQSYATDYSLEQRTDQHGPRTAQTGNLPEALPRQNTVGFMAPSRNQASAER